MSGSKSRVEPLSTPAPPPPPPARPCYLRLFLLLLWVISCCADYLLKLLLITWRGGIQREIAPQWLDAPFACTCSDPRRVDVCPSFVNLLMFTNGAGRALLVQGATSQTLLPPFARMRMRMRLQLRLRICGPFSYRFLRPNCCKISWLVYYTLRLQLQLQRDAATAGRDVACLSPIVANANGKWFG